ncbi:MAG: hypothetical protein M1404_05295 [Acidobacteria bacterium]|nr:hypothetical protein [Acidobacteriota bacterium]
MKGTREVQQTTLSAQLSQSLWDYIDRVRVTLSNRRGKRSSLSEAAKLLPGDAQHTPLDERLRVSSLFQDPTATLLEIRTKWEQRAVLSPAEWVVLAHYVELACEGSTNDVAYPNRESFMELLKAFRILLDLRVAGPSSHDGYYMDKLRASWVGNSERTYVGALVDDLLSLMSEPGSRVLPEYVGRTLEVALREEEYPSALALHDALSPFLPTLFRLGAHGHWLQTHRPVRPPRDYLSLADPHIGSGCIAVPACGGDFRVTTIVTLEGDLSMALNMNSRDVVFVVELYPQIREFMWLLNHLPEEGNWRGLDFFGYTGDCARGADITRLYFRKLATSLGFSPDEWAELRDAVRKILEAPELAPIVAELNMQYGFD